MSVHFPCSHCGQPVAADEGQVGASTRCPSCGADQLVPAAANAGYGQQPGAYPGAPSPGYGQQPGAYPGGPNAGYGQQPGAYPGGFQPQHSGYVQVEEGGGGNPLLRRLGGIGGFILLLLVVNVVLYVFDCGFIIW